MKLLTICRNACNGIIVNAGRENKVVALECTRIIAVQKAMDSSMKKKLGIAKLSRSIQNIYSAEEGNILGEIYTKQKMNLLKPYWTEEQHRQAAVASNNGRKPGRRSSASVQFFA